MKNFNTSCSQKQNGFGCLLHAVQEPIFLTRANVEKVSELSLRAEQMVDTAFCAYQQSQLETNDFLGNDEAFYKWHIWVGVYNRLRNIIFYYCLSPIANGIARQQVKGGRKGNDNQ